MLCRVVSHAVCVALLLSDRILVDSCLLVFDLSEFSQSGILCYIYRLGTVFCICRHGRIAFCFQCKGKALCSPPVVDLLGSFKLFLHRCISIGDRQAVCIAILDSRCQFVCCIICLSYGHGYRVRCCVVGNAVCSAVPLGDRVLVDACLLIRDLTKACQRFLLCCCCCCARRHRCAFGHCCKIKLEFCRLAPVCKVLGCLDFCLCRFISICDRQAVCITILNGCCESIRIGIF